MKHEELRERLHEYRDGELDGAVAAEVAAHLPACADCRGVLEGWERLAQGLLKAVPAAEEGFVGRVMARIAEEEREPVVSSGGWWLVPVFAAGAVLSLMWWPSDTSAAEDPLSDGVSWELTAQPALADDVLAVEAGEQP